jgi:hypothetical protein
LILLLVGLRAREARSRSGEKPSSAETNSLSFKGHFIPVESAKIFSRLRRYPCEAGAMSRLGVSEFPQTAWPAALKGWQKTALFLGYLTPTRAKSAKIPASYENNGNLV